MCSYCGCESIEVIGRFMAEHVEIINAAGDLRRAVASADAAALESARVAVAQLLWPHTGTEEQGLFRVLARQDEFRAHIDTLCGEHRELDARLAALTPGDVVAVAAFGPFLFGVGLTIMSPATFYWIGVGWAIVCVVITWWRYARPGAPRKS